MSLSHQADLRSLTLSLIVASATHPIGSCFLFLVMGFCWLISPFRWVLFCASGLDVVASGFVVIVVGLQNNNNNNNK